MTRIAIVGSRDYHDREEVERFVRSLPDDTIVVTGGARGVDTWAENAARDRGLDVVVHRADWARYGKAAGPIRNSELVNDSDAVVAFWDLKSSGTRDTVQKAVAAWKLVGLYCPPRFLK